MADELDEMMRMLGRLEEGQERMRVDFDNEKEHASESRTRMYSKLEKIETDVSIVGQVAAQARDKADAVSTIVTEDVKPVTDDVRRWRLMGLGALGIVGVAGTAFGTWLATWGEGVVNSLRHWLRIP